MRLPVGSVVFVSHRQVCEVSRAGKVSAKNTSQRMSQGRFFARTYGLTFPAREGHVATFAY